MGGSNLPLFHRRVAFPPLSRSGPLEDEPILITAFSPNRRVPW